MKKLLPVIISGVMAVSFSQLAAAQAAGVQGQAGAGANVDLNTKGSTEAQKELGQSRQQPGSPDTQSGKKQQHDTSATTGATAGATTGATADSSTKSGSEDTNSSSGAAKSNKMEGDSSSAGASQSNEKDKDKDKDKDRDPQGKNRPATSITK